MFSVGTREREVPAAFHSRNQVQPSLSPAPQRDAVAKRRGLRKRGIHILQHFLLVHGDNGRDAGGIVPVGNVLPRQEMRGGDGDCPYPVKPQEAEPVFVAPFEDQHDGVPAAMPMVRKNTAALVDISAMSAKPNVASAPFSSHHTRACFSGSARPISSTTSHAKLN